MNKFGVVIDEKDEAKLNEVVTIITKCKLLEPTTYAIVTTHSQEELEKMSFIKKVNS